MLLMNVCLCNLGQVVILKCNNSANSFPESFMMLLKKVRCIVYAEIALEFERFTKVFYN